MATLTDLLFSMTLLVLSAHSMRRGWRKPVNLSEFASEEAMMEMADPESISAYVVAVRVECRVIGKILNTTWAVSAGSSHACLGLAAEQSRSKCFPKQLKHLPNFLRCCCPVW